MPAASACPVRWLQHVKALQLTCMKLWFTNSYWIFSTVPAGYCILSVCFMSCIIFEKCINYGPSYLDRLVDTRLLKRVIAWKRCLSGHMDWFSLSICPFLKSLWTYVCLCVCLCARERTSWWKRECVCQRSDITGVSCLTLLEEAGSVECWGPPVSQVFSQAPAHENLFWWVQYCHLNRYQPTFRLFKTINASPPSLPQVNLQQFFSLTLSL